MVCDSANQWTQQTTIAAADTLLIPTNTVSSHPSATSMQQQQQPPIKCPRCDSQNTKFCYFNNYSRSQPRHFCKACRRYWTRGGALRTVPIGGGCRKNKRVRKPTPPAAAAAVSASLLTPNNSLLYSQPSAATYNLQPQQLGFHDSFANSFYDQVKVEELNNVADIDSAVGILDWQDQAQALYEMNQLNAMTVDSSYLYWSSAIGWPDI